MAAPRLRVAAVLLGLALAGCGGPSTDTKRVVAICVQEPARVIQQMYAAGFGGAPPPRQIPVAQVLAKAKATRSAELSQFSAKHRGLVEAKMAALASWINERMRVTETPGSAIGPLVHSTVDLPAAADLNAKAKALCIEAFGDW